MISFRIRHLRCLPHSGGVRKHDRTKARLVRRRQALQFLKPVEDDVDLGLSRFLLTSLDHKEPSIRPDIVGWVVIVVIVSFKQNLRTLEAELRVGINLDDHHLVALQVK